MKRLLFLLAGVLATVGVATAQAPAPGGLPFPPAYYGPGGSGAPGMGAGAMPGYYGGGQPPGGMGAPMPGYYGGGQPPGGMGAPMPGYYGGGQAPGGMGPMPGGMGGPMPGGMGGPMPPETQQASPYGWNQKFRGIFSWGKSCSTCDGKKKGGYFNRSKDKTPPEQAQGGTLVFPHHPFVRSPRDFFEQ